MNKLKARRVLWLVLVVLFLTSTPASAAFLIEVQVQKDGLNHVEGLNGANSVTLSPDGHYLYVTGFFDNALAVFRRDSLTGGLTFVEVQQDGVNGVDGLLGVFMAAVSPDGRNVYVTGGGDDAIAVFRRGSVTGTLAFIEVEKNGVGGVRGLGGANAIAISPDGRSVYVAGYDDNALVVFRRNRNTGGLTFVTAVENGVGGVAGLAGAYAVTVSADGRYVYAAGLTADAVALFDRDATTGRLTFVEVQRDGVAGVDGLDGVYLIAISPDGRSAYLPSLVDSAVAVFNRDPATGRLAFVEAKRDGVDGVDGLGMAFWLTIDPTGRRVYVAGYADNALAVFDRDGATGKLTPLEVEQDNAGGVEGLAGAISVTVSLDGRHIYVAGFGDDSVAVFSVPVTSFMPIVVQ